MAPREQVAVTSNGSTPPVDEREAAFESLRSTPENVHLFRGYAPLIAGILLFILMVLLVPSVAPERVVEQPVNSPTTTTVEASP